MERHHIHEAVIMDLIERKTPGALPIFLCGMNNEVAARLKLKLRRVPSPADFVVVLLGRIDGRLFILGVGIPFSDSPLTLLE
jgi:hypothetical protein